MHSTLKRKIQKKMFKKNHEWNVIDSITQQAIVFAPTAVHFSAFFSWSIKNYQQLMYII